MWENPQIRLLYWQEFRWKQGRNKENNVDKEFRDKKFELALFLAPFGKQFVEPFVRWFRSSIENEKFFLFIFTFSPWGLEQCFEIWASLKLSGF